MIPRRALLASAGLAPAMARPSLAQGRLATLETKLDDTLAPGLRSATLIRWGDRVEFDAPPFTPLTPTEDAAVAQFGWDGRLVALVAPPQAADGVARAVAVVAHPSVDAAMAFPAGQDRPAIALAMQGASILNLASQGGRWVIVDGGFQTRRLHGRSLCRVTGPARATLGDGVQGVLGPRGGCVTPWGTVLLTEGDPAPWMPRLRAAGHPAREGAFGWVVELDPLDPQSVPAKRTALGRLAAGDAAAAVTGDGRAVVYLTDRRGGGGLYRFISDDPAGADALDAGRLFAARIEGESLQWVPVADGARPAGGSPLPVPAGLAVDGRAQRLYLALRGGGGRILEIVPAAADHGADTAVVQTLLLGRPALPLPEANARARPSPALAWPDAPETLWADGRGRLFIGTDREGRVAAIPDALYACTVEGAERGRPFPVYGAPQGAGIGGAMLTPDGRALLVMVRHPGAEPGASWDRPGTTWPEFMPGTPPRSTVLLIAREDGRAL